MQTNQLTVDDVLKSCQSLGLVNQTERNELLTAYEPDFPYARAINRAETLHAHIKVEDVDTLPHGKLQALGYAQENKEPGYVKYTTGAEINLIFSSIPIAEDDNISGAVTLAKPFLDHLGVDMRDETAPTKDVFDSVVERIEELGWRRASQGGDDTPVHCCHTQVRAKHWAYPSDDWNGWRRPIEFAYGQLVIFDKAMGCALRPIDPGHTLAPETDCGCGG